MAQRDLERLPTVFLLVQLVEVQLVMSAEAGALLAVVSPAVVSLAVEEPAQGRPRWLLLALVSLPC